MDSKRQEAYDTLSYLVPIMACESFNDLTELGYKIKHQQGYVHNSNINMLIERAYVLGLRYQKQPVRDDMNFVTYVPQALAGTREE